MFECTSGFKILTRFGERKEPWGLNCPSQTHTLNTQSLACGTFLKALNEELGSLGLAGGSRSTRGGSLKGTPTSVSNLFSLLPALLGCEKLPEVPTTTSQLSCLLGCVCMHACMHTCVVQNEWYCRCPLLWKV